MVSYSRSGHRPVTESAELSEAARVAVERAFPVRWGAIGCGVVIALVVQILLSLLGVALGFSALVFASPAQDITGPAMSAFWWWALSGVIAAFCGGVIAGVATSSCAAHAGVNAFIAWAFATVVVSVVLSGGAGGALTAGAAFISPLAFVSEQLASATSGNSYALRALVIDLSFWSVVALLVGAGAAVCGGRIGFTWNLIKQPRSIY